MEGMFEAFGDFFEGAHGEVAFFELAIDHPFMDDGVDHLIDFLGGDAFETSGGAFDGIGEAEDIGASFYICCWCEGARPGDAFVVGCHRRERTVFHGDGDIVGAAEASYSL